MSVASSVTNRAPRLRSDSTTSTKAPTSGQVWVTGPRAASSSHETSARKTTLTGVAFDAAAGAASVSGLDGGARRPQVT